MDTHADFHVAATVDHNGGLLGIESFPADLAGFEDLLGWLATFGEVEQVGGGGHRVVGCRSRSFPRRCRC